MSLKGALWFFFKKSDVCPKCDSGDVTLLGSDNYGECNYSSYGGGVDEFVVSVYRCKSCGCTFMDTKGSVCGDESEMIEETLNRYAYKDV